MASTRLPSGVRAVILRPVRSRSGRKALEIVFDPAAQYNPAYMTWRRARDDWSGYDALILEVFNPASEPVEGVFLVADQAWADKGRTYWNRHNATTMLAPGRTRWVISVGGLYRGEAGSRNNDIKRDIDIHSIVRVDFGFGAKGSSGRTATLAARASARSCTMARSRP